jgi:leucyl-tRNA synthetase
MPCYYFYCSPCGLKPEQFTDAVWDAVFLEQPLPTASVADAALAAVVKEMRTEFEYWYPMDLRCSAKVL